MEDVISFIQANYVWFIILIGVIVMTVVGYFAEKSGFAFGERKAPKNIDSNEEDFEESVELKDTSTNREEGIADIIKENSEEPTIQSYEEQVVDQPVEDEKINLVASDEDLYKPLSDSDNKEEEINGIPEELYAPLDSTVQPVEQQMDSVQPVIEEQPAYTEPVYEQPVPEVQPITQENPEEEKIELENVSPFSIEPEESKEPVEDENSEYSRLFPSDPIIIGGENKEEPQEEVAQEDLWNI